MSSRYSDITTQKRWDGKQVYITTHYPTITPSSDDLLIITNETDTLDTLSYRYYNDPTAWWIIALMNNISDGRLSVKPGIQLRIPMNVNKIMDDFNRLNK